MADLGTLGFTPDPDWAGNGAALVTTAINFGTISQYQTLLTIGTNTAGAGAGLLVSAGTSSSGGGLLTHPGMAGGMRG